MYFINRNNDCDGHNVFLDYFRVQNTDVLEKHPWVMRCITYIQRSPEDSYRRKLRKTVVFDLYNNYTADIIVVFVPRRPFVTKLHFQKNTRAAYINIDTGITRFVRCAVIFTSVRFLTKRSCTTVYVQFGNAVVERSFVYGICVHTNFVVYIFF